MKYHEKRSSPNIRVFSSLHHSNQVTGVMSSVINATNTVSFPTLGKHKDQAASYKLSWPRREAQGSVQI